MLFFYITKTKIGTYKNPLTYYLIFWVWWILISFLNPFDLYSVSIRAYLLIWMNILFFSIGYFLFCRKIPANIYFTFNNKREYAFVLLQFIVLLLIFYYYRKYNHLLNIMTILDSRRIVFEPGLLLGSYKEYAVYNYFIASFLYLSVVINISKYVLTSKKTISLIITLISVILFGLTGLGRFIFFNSIVFFIIASALKKPMFIQKKSNGIRKKTNENKLRYFLLIFAGLIYMVILTGRRMGKVVTGFNDFINLFRFSVEQGIIYFVGPFRAFDSFLNLRIYDRIGFTFGRSTFGGLDEIINILTIIIGLNIESANAKIASFTVDNIYIGTNQQFNAFYTGVMNFYLDGGILGVVILAFLYGVIAAGVWNHYNKYPNLFSYSLLIYFTYTTISYEYSLAFTSVATWVILFILTLGSYISSKRKMRFLNEEITKELIE
jgi:oligosaccharide repeat unit polymerase